jgi:hypothetical protein
MTAMPSRRKQLKPRHVDAEEDNDAETTSTSLEPIAGKVSGVSIEEIEDLEDDDSDPVGQCPQATAMAVAGCATAVQSAGETGGKCSGKRDVTLFSDVDDIAAGKFILNVSKSYKLLICSNCGDSFQEFHLDNGLTAVSHHHNWHES